MLKYLIVAFVTLELIVLSSGMFTPANAVSNDPNIYLWDYAKVGANQLVCKKVVIHVDPNPVSPESQMQAANFKSDIVDDNYCANLTQPKA